MDPRPKLEVPEGRQVHWLNMIFRLLLVGRRSVAEVAQWAEMIQHAGIFQKKPIVLKTTMRVRRLVGVAVERMTLKMLLLALEVRGVCRMRRAAASRQI